MSSYINNKFNFRPKWSRKELENDHYQDDYITLPFTDHKNDDHADQYSRDMVSQYYD